MLYGEWVHLREGGGSEGIEGIIAVAGACVVMFITNVFLREKEEGMHKDFLMQFFNAAPQA